MPPLKLTMEYEQLELELVRLDPNAEAELVKIVVELANMMKRAEQTPRRLEIRQTRSTCTEAYLFYLSSHSVYKKLPDGGYVFLGRAKLKEELSDFQKVYVVEGSCIARDNDLQSTNINGGVEP